MVVPGVVGWMLERYGSEYAEDGIKTYDYTWPMVLFAFFALSAFWMAVLLKKENKIKQYGLDLPNMKE